MRASSRAIPSGGSTKSMHPVAIAERGMPSYLAVSILRQRDAARAFDGFDPQGAIRTGAGENYADRAFAHVFGERAEKAVHGHVDARPGGRAR